MPVKNEQIGPCGVINSNKDTAQQHVVKSLLGFPSVGNGVLSGLLAPLK